MKQRLQGRLQRELSRALPGFVVRCEFSSTHVIDVFIDNYATHEAIWISGVNSKSLLDPNALDAVVNQLMVEIMAIVNVGLDRTDLE